MDWHRLFGLLLTDFFAGSPFTVELEKDLSLRQQFLDVVILRRGASRFAGTLPDGLDDLAAHNLITFKSHQQALDDWSLKELVGHYVSYRKLVSPSRDELLPEGEFQLYAVCSRYPHNLVGLVTLEPVQPGVYRCRWGTDLIRVVVVRQLPEVERNAPLHLFSGSPGQVTYAARHYRQRSKDTSTLLEKLVASYRGEGVVMPYTMEDFRRDYAKEHFKDLTTEERREVLQSLSPEERRQMLEVLPPEELEAILKKLKAEGSPRARKRRRKG